MAKTQLGEVALHYSEGLAAREREEGVAHLPRDVEQLRAAFEGVGLVWVFNFEESPSDRGPR